MSAMSRFLDVDVTNVEDDDLTMNNEFSIIPLVDLTEEEEPSGPVNRRTGLARSFNEANSRTARQYGRQESPKFLTRAARFARLDDDTVIKADDTVELQMPPDRMIGTEHSGDFFRIVKIVQNNDNGDFTLHGHRLVREMYLLGRGSDGKVGRMNELGEFLSISEDDDRPAYVQGLEKIPLWKVKCKRKVIFTEKPYPMHSYRDSSSSAYKPTKKISSKEQLRKDIFNNASLVCRWARTSIVSPNGKAYGGTFRHRSGHKNTTPSHLSRTDANNPSTTNPTTGHARTPSLEEVTKFARVPFTKKKYRFVDIYCGAGGASKGASNAGLKVIAGLDHDDLAILAWEKNNPNGTALMLDAFEFLENGRHKVVGICDILHISNPCQPFAPSHTIAGKNDEINIKQLDTIKPLLELLKPRILTLENTSGLANMEENRPYFNKLLRDISTAGPGYNLHYRVINMADYGLPQQRKRLLIIAARKGYPLPPFPKPTHGPEGSGLRPYVTIGDTLELLEHLEEHLRTHKYHKVHPQAAHQYDPYENFLTCITTSGVTMKHWMGEDFTPLELALLQSLPYDFQLCGSWARATKQIGNMFPPLMAEIIYRLCAQTLEAFDDGLIGAHDEIFDLDITLLEKGVNILESPSATSKYQYLTPITIRDTQQTFYSSAWAQRNLSGRKRDLGFDSLKAESDDSSQDNTPTPEDNEPRRCRRRLSRSHTDRREEEFWNRYNGRVIDLSDD